MPTANADGYEWLGGIGKVGTRRGGLDIFGSAVQASSLGELVQAAGGADRDTVWEALDFLLHLLAQCNGLSPPRSSIPVHDTVVQFR